MEARHDKIKFCKKEKDQDEYIKQLELSLAGGASIDLMFTYKDIHGTVLAHAVKHGFDKLVRYALDQGASITAEIKWNENADFKFSNAIELSLSQINRFKDSKSCIKIFDMLKEKSLELLSSNGLTSFHIDSSIQWFNTWSCQLEDYLQTVDLNATINADSPFWPGMTPLLIAAKFKNLNLIIQLLEYGALATTRDSGGNTALHYLYHYDIMVFKLKKFVDYAKRLFVFDGKDTFGTYTGESHFHIACRLCPITLKYVKKYLDLGISPNLQTKENRCHDLDPIGKTGLHIARLREADPSPELIQLLLEYGADVDIKDANGDVALNNFIGLYNLPENNFAKHLDCICLLLEAGANIKIKKVDDFKMLFCDERMENSDSVTIIKCIKRTRIMNITSVTEETKNVYKALLKFLNRFDDNDYEKLCLQELIVLSKCGLRQLLDQTIKNDFKEKFEAIVDSPELLPQLYPIYGRMLKIQMKRKLFLYEEKRKKINEAIPRLQLIFQSSHVIPDLVAQNILWNLDTKDIDRLILKV